MAITFVAAGTVATANSDNVTPGLPAGWAANDIQCLLVIAADNVVCTLPAGWTKKIEVNNGINERLTFAWRRAVAGDTAPLVTHTAGGEIDARIAAFRGAITSGDPFDAAGTGTTTANSTTVNAAAITPLNANDMILFIGGLTSATLIPTFSAYSGTNPTFSEAFQDNYNGPVFDVAQFMAYGIKTDTTTTGARTATASDAADNVGALLAMTAAVVAVVAARGVVTSIQQAVNRLASFFRRLVPGTA